MEKRRRFLAALSGVAVPAGMAVLTAGSARADDTKYLGTWILQHPSPLGGFFREMMCFGAGGALQENNSFLHPNSRINLSALGLPAVLNAGDGLGSWEQGRGGEIQFEFRKMLFDGSSGANVYWADLRVTGSARGHGDRLNVDWHIYIVNDSGTLNIDLGPASSAGSIRIG
jgi:hypothetical protein